MQTNCYPYWVWSGTANGSNYKEHELVNGNFNGPYNYAVTWALSVRCVLDLKPTDNCYPRNVWSSTPSGSSYYDYYLNSGTFNKEAIAGTFANSVRCVLDLKTPARANYSPILLSTISDFSNSSSKMLSSKAPSPKTTVAPNSSGELKVIATL